MTYALDHVFVCCAEGAPEAERLVRLGLAEGAPNTHPGQGTACRRFFFENAYIELFWVTNAQEAQAEPAAPARLWPRWSRRAADASPFAIILRPAEGGDERDLPFASWTYHPAYLPPHLAIDVAEGTPLSEPAFFYIAFARPPGLMQTQPRGHGLGVRRITAIEIGMPGSAPCAAARAVQEAGIVTFVHAAHHVMTVTFDDARAGESADLRPELPLVFRW